jgi:hypothetical protein
MTLQHEFEYYMRNTLPMKLNLSPSKKVASEIIFYHFSDFAKDLAVKSPDEFRYFFDGLKSNVERIEKWKCPKTHMITPKLTKDRNGSVALAKRSGGKTVYTMYPKTDEAKLVKSHD